MSDGLPPAGVFGAVVRVRDLKQARAFYQDVVGLGSPVMDSNFWVEFALPGNGLLALEQCPAAETDTPRPNVSWLLSVPDFEAKCRELTERHVALVRPPLEIPGCHAATFADPEGNAFTVYARVKPT